MGSREHLPELTARGGNEGEEGVDWDGVLLGPRVTGGAVGPWRLAQKRGGLRLGADWPA